MEVLELLLEVAVGVIWEFLRTALSRDRAKKGLGLV
jgi:hypothetical protein